MLLRDPLYVLISLPGRNHLLRKMPKAREARQKASRISVGHWVAVRVTESITSQIDRRIKREELTRRRVVVARPQILISSFAVCVLTIVLQASCCAACMA